jgi:hypothetical protein
MINVGDTRPRQLLITAEGEIFGGHLASPSPDSQSAAPSIPLQLSSGQLTRIPLSQISRLGYRKRAGEPEEWPLAKPMITLRTGDRMQIDVPKGPIAVATRYGHLSLSPQSVAALVLASEDHAVHEILLADGSRFAGLVDADTFTLTLSGPKQEVKFPANAITRIQFAAPQDPDAAAATLDLTNGDKLVGQLSSPFKLDTSFDTLTINGPEVKRLTHADPNAPDVQVTLWDDSTLSGQLRQPDLPVQLNSGLSLAIPAALIGDYANPQPAPSPAMADKIRGLVADLGADDYHRRERAEAALAAIGPSVRRTLKDLKPAQPPEAQQRIDSILKQVDGKPDRSTGPADRNAR